MRPWMMMLVLMTACGDKDQPIENDDEGGGDTVIDTQECDSDGDCGSSDICEDNECVDGDRNNSVEEAETLLPDDDSDGYFINPSGDEDYYSYTSNGGEFIRIAVTSPDESKSDVDVYDTYLTLRDPDLRVIAEVDNYPTGASLSSADSILYAYLAEAGTYTLVVEDNGTYVGESAYGDNRYEYAISIATWGQHTEDEDAADDPGLSIDMDSANSYYAIGVALEEEGDIDYVELNMAFDNNRFYVLGQVDVLDGVNPQVKLHTEDGETLMDVAPLSGGASAYYPATQDGDYILELSDEDGDGGDNEWFFVFLLQDGGDSASPVEDEDNGLPILATPLEFTENSNSSGDYTVSNVLGFADPTKGKDGYEVDEDWYSIEAFDDGFLVVCLSSSYYGSAITPTLSLIEQDGTTVLEEVEGSEDEYPTAVIENVEVIGGDTYYVKVTNPEDATGSPMEWYEFTLYVADFSIGNYGCPP
ncbi:MAG: hypothetical protein ACI8RZ_007511 [Myxococcota bacterium]|jgi:hypothetical protein